MLKKFIEENFERDINSFVKYKTLHKMYLEFARSNGLDKISQATLTKRLNKEFIGGGKYKCINGENVKVRYGLKVKK